jgi:hypothetical protein
VSLWNNATRDTPPRSSRRTVCHRTNRQGLRSIQARQQMRHPRPLSCQSLSHYPSPVGRMPERGHRNMPGPRRRRRSRTSCIQTALVREMDRLDPSVASACGGALMILGVSVCSLDHSSLLTALLVCRNLSERCPGKPQTNNRAELIVRFRIFTAVFFSEVRRHRLSSVLSRRPRRHHYPSSSKLTPTTR